MFDVGVMLAFGLLAYCMEANGFPIAPTILGLVLGGMLEQNFVTSMIKAGGNPLAFFERPIAGGARHRDHPDLADAARTPPDAPKPALSKRASPAVSSVF